MCTVVNKYKEDFDIYIGRGSKWGNPFPISGENSREKVIDEYRFYLWSQIKSGEVTTDDLLSLNGKRLGCFCKPKPCHGDVIKKAVEWTISQNLSAQLTE